ncbi:MAG: hypothetical protein ACJ8GN_06805 [Longimicrobiaceae bacterium]
MHEFQLEALNEDMFAPLSEKEASLVVGGQAAEVIGYSYYDAITLWSDGRWTPDKVIVDWIVAVPIEDVAVA